MERRKVSTPKAFFVSERDRFYDNWTLSFWREDFQNSVDAGARNIDISVETAPSRGSFDDVAPELDQVTRVVFTDDGSGMTKDVLEKVFFSIGSSTKGDGDSIGGYGRARLMTCFSNVRYTILTNDRFVIGDGPDWESYELGQAVAEIGKAIVKLEADGTERAARAIAGLRADLDMISKAQAAGGFKGCRIEVDLDPTQGYSWSRPTKDHMLKQLQAYLSESQLPPKVTINGKSPEDLFELTDGKGKLQARRGPVRRVLEAEVGGETKTFANVHLNESDRAAHKKKVIVRVNGASMFVDSIEADIQVIVELDPKMSRDVMTSNRDGLRGEYKKALQAFLQEIAVDNKSALKERGKEKITIKGEKGRIKAKRPSFEEISRVAMSDEEVTFTRHPEKRPPRVIPANTAQLAEFGLPLESVEAFIRDFRHGRTFVNDKIWDYDFPYAEDFRKLRDAAYEARWGEETSFLFENLSTEARGWLLDILKGRYVQELARVTAENAKRDVIEDMNDIVVHVENSNPTIRAAIRRNDPRNWDVETGKGRQPRALLVAWTEACGVAVETLMKVRPSVKDFDWTSGWCYDTAKQTDQGDRYRDAVTEALCVSEDGKHAFLVNPVTEDGRLAFSPSDAGDRQKLIALAMHEVAHVVESWHNETYAGVLTDLLKSYDFKEANRRMRDSVKAVYAAYDKGKARVQEMDDEPGPRPADRLLAVAAPAAYRNDALDAAVTRYDDGTRVVDCDAVARIELNQAPDLSREEGYAVRYA